MQSFSSRPFFYMKVRVQSGLGLWLGGAPDPGAVRLTRPTHWDGRKFSEEVEVHLNLLAFVWKVGERGRSRVCRA